MKKLTLVAIIGASTCLASFGQGYFTYSAAGAVGVYDNFTTPGSPVKSSGNIITAILWSTDLAAVPVFGSTPSSSTTSMEGLTLSKVLTDSNYTLALETDGVTPWQATTSTSALEQGGYFGNGGNNTPIYDTSTGETIEMYVIGWASSDGLTFSAAEQNSLTEFGWSNPFTMGPLQNAGTPGPSLTASGVESFYVDTAPEPGTFALAGLSAAALFIFRRRK
jgi:hypothetical protein